MFDPLFCEKTHLGHTARLDYGTFEGKFRNTKHGYERASAFEIKASVTNPEEILESAKDPESFFYIRPVGQIGRTQWYTLAVVRTTDDKVTTAFNVVSYSQKGRRVWP